MASYPAWQKNHSAGISWDYIQRLNRIWSDDGKCYADETCKQAMPPGEECECRNLLTLLALLLGLLLVLVLVLVLVLLIMLLFLQTPSGRPRPAWRCAARRPPRAPSSCAG